MVTPNGSDNNEHDVTVSTNREAIRFKLA